MQQQYRRRCSKFRRQQFTTGAIAAFNHHALSVPSARIGFGRPEMKKIFAVFVSALVGFSAALLTAPAYAEAGVLDELRSRGVDKWVEPYIGEDKNGKVYYKKKSSSSDNKATTTNKKLKRSLKKSGKSSKSLKKWTGNKKLTTKKLTTKKLSTKKLAKASGKKKKKKSKWLSKWKSNGNSNVSDRLASYGIK
jgi:hypothetical protein